MGWLTDYVDEIMDDTKKKFEKAVDDASKEFFKLEKEKTEKIYKNTIDDFYNSYKRKYYKPNKSLYKLLKCETDNKCLIINFHPEKIVSRTGYSGEDGLYTSVFKEGWHGGSGNKNGKSYPVAVYEGGKYFPYDGIVKPYEDRYYDWIPAKQADISPFDDFKKRWDDFQNSEFEEDANRIFNKHLDKI